MKAMRGGHHPRQTVSTSDLVDVNWQGPMHHQNLINTWSVPSLLLGFHVMHGVLAGIKMTPHHSSSRHQTTPSVRESASVPKIPQHIPKIPQHIPRLPDILERRVDIKKLVPRRRNLKPQRLMKKMGKDYDTFWMSQHPPNDFLNIQTKPNIDPALQTELEALDLPSVARKMVNNVLEASLLRLNESSSTNSTGIDASNDTATPTWFSSSKMASDVLHGLESWLVQAGSCSVYYKWKDMGLLYWPRFLRRGMCSLQDQEEEMNPFIRHDSASPPASSISCSWPPGMHCVAGKEKKVKILRWNCRNVDRVRHTGRRKSNLSASGIVHADDTHTKEEGVGHLLHDHDDADHYEDEHEDHQGDANHDHDETDFPRHAQQQILQIIRNQNKDAEAKESTKKAHRHGKHRHAFRNNHPKQNRHKNHKSPLDRHQHTTTTTTTTKLKDRQAARAQQAEVGGIRAQQTSGSRRHRRDASRRRKVDRHGKGKRKGRKRTGLKCRWVKVTFPVVDDCFCSC